MPSVSWISWGSLLVVCLAAAGCEPGYEPFPPPKDWIPPATSSTPGGAGDGGASGGAGASAGTGGAGGSAKQSNACECLHMIATDSDCATCFSANIKSGAACQPEGSGCEVSASCVDIVVDCPYACTNQMPAPTPDELATCIQSCVLPLEPDNEGEHRFFELMDCICGSACKTVCSTTTPLVCE